MRHITITNLRIASLTLCGLLTLSVGCSSFRQLQRDVGMKQKRIKLKDLGPSYVKFKKTEFDFFSKNSEVKARTKVRPIIIRYKTFRLNKFDRFTKQANVIYGKFRYANALIERFNRQLSDLLKTDVKGESRKAIRSAVKKRSSKKLKSVRRLQRSRTSLKLSLKACKELIADANQLIKNSEGIVKQSTAAVKRDPEKAILADKVLAESKQSLKRLREVITKSPKLLSALKDSLRIVKVTKLAKDM